MNAENITVHQKHSTYFSVKKKVHELLDPEMNTGWGKFVNYCIVTLIILNTIAVIFETVDEFNHHYHYYLRVFDLISLVFFTLEYLLRLWSCNVRPKFRHSVFGRLRYMFTLTALIDLIAIFPFYMPFILGTDMRFARTLRIMLFFRFLKLGRYMSASKVIVRVIKNKKEELLVSMFLFLFLIMIASCLMYYTEHIAQPDKFTNIPQTMWWSVCTLTTVGYGDLYPITVLGKILTGVIILFGIGMLALPTGILASGFSEEFNKKKHRSQYCHHCGEKIHEE